jgi:leader peptidase (prepilin peptidase)/N-methyltransferase
MALYYVLSFVLGAAIGSFLNVVINRTALKEGIVFKPSHCPHCKNSLGFFELIPILSFIFLKGRCRYCQEKISLQYPLVEGACGFLFVLIISNFLDNGLVLSEVLPVIYWLIVGATLIIIFVYDFKHYLIPNRFVYVLIFVSLVYFILNILLFGENNNFSNFVLAAALGAGFFLLLILITAGKGMGMGDAKLAFALGLVLGWPEIIIGIFAAFLIAALVSIYLMIFKDRGLKSKLPFGPFLVLGTLVVFLWGEMIIEWYLFPLKFLNLF